MLQGSCTQEVLNKCLWRLQQPPWSRVGSLSEGLRNQRETERQRQGDTERKRQRETPLPWGSQVALRAGPLLPAKATLGPVLLHPVFGSLSQQSCHSLDEPVLWEPQVGAGVADCPQGPPPPCPLLSPAWFWAFFPGTSCCYAHSLSSRAGRPSSPGRGGGSRGLGHTHTHLVDGHGGPVELVHLGGHRVGAPGH